MLLRLQALTVAGMLGLASAVSAQETPKWSDIDCAQSKIVGPTGLKCRATQEFSGGSYSEGKISGGLNATGTFRYWNMSGVVNGARAVYFLKEATKPGSTILPASLASIVKEYSFQGRGASQFTEPAPISGGDSLRFVDDKGEACIAVRKIGAPALNGNRWYLLATKCVPKGQSIPDSEPAAFLATAAAPKAGF